MRELRMFLERKASDPSSIVIIPVFYELTVEQCENLEQLYASEPWPASSGVPRVEDKAVLKGWAAAVQQLLGATGAKIEEVREASTACAGGMNSSSSSTEPGMHARRHFAHHYIRYLAELQ
jgi:hypothetical protein